MGIGGRVVGELLGRGTATVHPVATLMYPRVEILPGWSLDNEESVRHTNGKAGRSTKQKHRTDENNEE